MSHPMQPVEVDRHGAHRFKPNKIVQFLLDSGPYDMNALARMNWSDEDREQFAMLIGYSVSGFAGLSYVSDDMCARAEAASRELEKGS